MSTVPECYLYNRINPDLYRVGFLYSEMGYKLIDYSHNNGAAYLTTVIGKPKFLENLYIPNYQI